MSIPGSFTSTEVRTLQFAPLWVFIAVAAADGKVDKKEVEAFGKELSEANLFKEPLAREILLSVGNDFANIWAALGADSRNVVTGLTQVADLLDRRVPPQVAYNFKAALLMIGYNISESTGKGMFGTGQKALDQKHKALDAVAIIMRFSMGRPAPVAAPSPGISKKTITPKPSPLSPPPPKKRTSLYLVVDSSRYISDIAFLLDGGIRRIPEKMLTRPQRGIAVEMSLILADNSGRIATALTEATSFSAPSLLGRGSCRLGQALSNLLSDINTHRTDGKPLIVLVLAGPPEDDWGSAADQLRDLATQGKINVFVIAVGGYSNPTVLRRFTTKTPLALTDVTQENMQKSFDWLYSITDVILSGMESGASGQRRDVPGPPACLKVIK
jgi:uncharacterized protein YegL